MKFGYRDLFRRDYDNFFEEGLYKGVSRDNIEKRYEICYEKLLSLTKDFELSPFPERYSDIKGIVTNDKLRELEASFLIALKVSVEISKQKDS